MRHAANETSTQTLTRLITALDKQHPVTITYLKEEIREVIAVNSKGVATRRTIKTGRLVETIRTIEIHNIIVSQAGDILVRAMDRETGEFRSFRLDRIQAYTVHRTAYVIERPAADAAESRTVGLATVTVLYPVDCPIAQRIDLLASALAA
ncbi:WYL domain-containing protein [Streptomyces spinosirectus]